MEDLNVRLAKERDFKKKQNIYEHGEAQEKKKM